MTEQAQLSAQLERMMAKARRSLTAAERDLAAEDFDFASSRAYYAAFYAIQATLLTKGLSFSKHATTIGEFNREFVRTGAFPKDFTKLLSRLFRERQLGDYDFAVSISRDDARIDLDAAQKIVTAVERHLRALSG